jgi:hypothetical protein
MTSLQVEGRFAVVPEWVIDARISDAAVRLYAVLVRYGHSSGSRMPFTIHPGRTTAQPGKTSKPAYFSEEATYPNASHDTSNTSGNRKFCAPVDEPSNSGATTQ